MPSPIEIRDAVGPPKCAKCKNRLFRECCDLVTEVVPSLAYNFLKMQSAGQFIVLKLKNETESDVETSKIVQFFHFFKFYFFALHSGILPQFTQFFALKWYFTPWECWSTSSQKMCDIILELAGFRLRLVNS